MNDKAWASWAVILAALGNALAAAAGAIPVEQGAGTASAVVIVGALGKALYAIGTGMRDHVPEEPVPGEGEDLATLEFDSEFPDFDEEFRPPEIAAGE